jgi:hypothetical protein
MLIFNSVYLDEIIKFLTEMFHRIYYAVNVFINLILNKGLVPGCEHFSEAMNLWTNLKTWHVKNISSRDKITTATTFLLIPFVFIFNA